MVGSLKQRMTRATDGHLFPPSPSTLLKAYPRPYRARCGPSTRGWAIAHLWSLSIFENRKKHK